MCFAGIFRRIIIPNVPWYKERILNNISLGSLSILCLLRVLVFNVNKLKVIYLQTIYVEYYLWIFGAAGLNACYR